MGADWLKLSIKNIHGWKTRRRLVTISVDDYGNVRVGSKKAREAITKEGLEPKNRFDAYDSLETREDLEAMFEILMSVKDRNGRHAVLTPFSVTCNIDFERMAQEGYSEYHYETLPQTYEKLSVIDPVEYAGTWDLWKKGMEHQLLVPQFHGREHFNLKVFREKLLKKDWELMLSLKNRSLTNISGTGYPSVNFTAAFEFWDYNEKEDLKGILRDGLRKFRSIYGYESTHFNPAGGRANKELHQGLAEEGIKMIDVPRFQKTHLGFNKYRTEYFYTGKKNDRDQLFMVKNCVFEPTVPGIDWIEYSLKQIDYAFKFNNPATISTHRVNYCGHISSENRKLGVNLLKELLKRIVIKWPDVEFLSTHELLDIMQR